MLIEAWRRVVLSMGERLGFGPAVRIWFLASLGKYVPGKVWAVAGAAVLAQRAGVDPSVAVAGALVLQALAIASGAVAVALTARDAFQAAGPGMVPLAAVVLVLSFAGIAALASQPLLDRVNRLLPSSIPPLRAVPPDQTCGGFRRESPGLVRLRPRTPVSGPRSPAWRHIEPAPGHRSVYLLLFGGISRVICPGRAGTARVRVSPHARRCISGSSPPRPSLWPVVFC